MLIFMEKIFLKKLKVQGYIITYIIIYNANVINI